MNILVIGNGFDLAHGLPTQYTHFLKCCKMYMDSETSCNLCENGEEFRDLITNNSWIAYFMHLERDLGPNWIDFESEISCIIQFIDEYRTRMSGSSTSQMYQILRAKLLTFLEIINTPKGTINIDNKLEELISTLLTDLERLIRALEIYIYSVTAGAPIKLRSPDIDELSIDHVLSFNYSSTYEDLYGKKPDIVYDYIHGKADISHSLETNNMVLGIDEYLPEDRQNEEVDFIAFKKYYQRVFKNTSRLAEEWCDIIDQDAQRFEASKRFIMENQIGLELVEKQKLDYTWGNFERLADIYVKQLKKAHSNHHIYIYGHSLDITDKDILRRLLLNDNAYVTIYYHKTKLPNGAYDNGRIERGKKITNLVKLIGQDELKKRTAGINKTIELRLQSDMTVLATDT